MKLTTRLRALVICIFIISCLAPGCQSQRASEESDVPEKPNIVVLFIDDWAWNGTPIRMDEDMPNSRMPVLQMLRLEKFGAEGMKFRNAYSGAPQCSPSR